jgi:hypothetical protein
VRAYDPPTGVSIVIVIDSRYGAAMTTTDRPVLGRRGSSFATWCLRGVAVVAVLVAVVLPLYRLSVAGGSVPVSLVADAAPTVAVPGLPDGVTASVADGTVSLDVVSLGPGLRLLTEASGVLVALAVAAGAWWLAGVLGTVAAGRPFDRRNSARLRGVAAAVLVGGVLAPVLDDLAGLAVLEHLDLLGPDSPFVLTLLHVNAVPVLLTLVVLAAAEAFRRGAALADDVDGLV